MYDLIIRNGSITDGTGRKSFPADLAVDGTRIAAIGNIPAPATREIDAEGQQVCPGFVDIHTHLDAQISWDPMLTPISWHGVTTALLGNCGVTFAPCRPQDRELLAGMMETVEDIPRDAIMSNLSWQWEGYGAYLDSLELLDPAINVTGLIGHCALRFYVMGERAVEEQATATERAEMARLAKQAVQDGAVGFSTSRFLGHYLPDGRHVPGTHAAPRELAEIAVAVGSENGLMQNVMNLGGDFEGEMALLRRQAESARVLFSTATGRNDAFGDAVERRVMAMRADGLDVNAVAIPRGSGFVTGLQANLMWRTEAWQKLADMRFEDRVLAISEPHFYARLVSEAKQKDTRFDARQVFYLGEGDTPNYIRGSDESLFAMARDAGEHIVETYLRLAKHSGGTALFTIRFFNQNIDSLAKTLSSEFCLPGLGDAGAHVSQIMDAGWSTFVLSHWYRKAGLYSLEEAIRRITSAPARIIGLTDRGTLEVGKKADINVIDIDRVSERMPQLVHDFPGGAPRFIQKARGYRATICNGRVILENDAFTGSRGGKVLRHAQVA